MKKEFEKKLKRHKIILKIIGLIEILGGITGIGLILWLTLQGTQTSSLVFLILLVAFAFYSYSIFAGVTLFKNQEKSIIHSQIVQFIQIIALSIGGVTYLLTSGGNLFVGYNFTDSTLEFSMSIISSEFQINIMSSGQNEFIHINLMATIILLILENSGNKIKKQKTLKENYEQSMIEYIGNNNEA